MPTFQQVYDCLRRCGPAHVISSRNTQYTVVAGLVSETPTIIGHPRTGRIYVHADCWGQDITCKSTRAGGLYNGPYSIHQWYAEHCDAT